MGHVHGDPSKPKFEDLAFDAVKRRDFTAAANSVMDSFMMDDPDPEDVENLETMLAGLPAGARIDDLRRVVDSWRKSGPRNNHATMREEYDLLEATGQPADPRFYNEAEDQAMLMFEEMANAFGPSPELVQSVAMALRDVADMIENDERLR